MFFVSYQSDPAAFITLQRTLGTSDALNEYIRHTGSALFACPSGTGGTGEYWGQALFT